MIEFASSTAPSYGVKKAPEMPVATPVREAKPVRGEDVMARRRALQVDATRCFLESKRVLVNWGTGTGKSRVGIYSVAMLYRYFGCRRFLLLVDQTPHKKNWKDEFGEAFADKDLGDLLYGLCTVECYASLKKYVGTEWDCVICDEAHHLRGENRTGMISLLKTPRMLLLSATMSEKGDGDALLGELTGTFGPFETLDFSVQDGIDAGFIGVPKIHIHVLALEEIKAEQEITVTWGFKNARKRLLVDAAGYEKVWDRTKGAPRKGYPHMDLTVRCSARDAYTILTEQCDYYRTAAETAEGEEFFATGDEKAAKSKRAALMRTMQRNCGARRKAFLGHCKTEAVTDMIAYLEKKNTKFLCFCTDIRQIKLLGGDGERIIHSGDGRSKKTNQEVIDAFNSDRIRSLFAVDMAREGQNLRGIEAGIIVQLDGKERQFVQKFGRVLRSKNPVQEIYVVQGTKDEEWLVNAMTDIDTGYVTVHMPGEKIWRRWSDTPYEDMLRAARERAAYGDSAGLIY